MGSNRKKILAVNYFSVFPPTTGGPLAIWGLHKNLARWFDIEIVDFDEINNVGSNEVSDYLLNTTISKINWKKDELNFFKEDLDDSIQDFCIHVAREYDKDEYFVKRLKLLAKDADIIFTEHPYTYRLVKKACPNKIIWYRAHNVEYAYKASVYANLSKKDELVKEVYEIEQECCDGCDLILTVTDEDLREFQSVYGVDKNKLMNLSSGYEWESCDFVLPETRSSSKNSKDLDGDSDRSLNKEQYKASAFFISGSHEPGVKAAKLIIEIARIVPSVLFIIAGSVKKGLDDLGITENVEVLGIIDNFKKEELLKSCDMALNSTEYGSGLNIKMLEYFAFGIPVITTKFGARGLNVTNGKEVIIADSNNLGQAIENFHNQSMEYKNSLASNARQYVIENFTWRNSAKKILDYIKVNNIFEYSDEFSFDERKLLQIRKPMYLYHTQEYIKYIFARMDNEDVFLWGASEAGKRVLSLLKGYNKKCCGFIDNNPSKWGEEFCGVPIMSPDKYINEYPNAIVIISSMYVPEIYKQLMNMGVERINVLTNTLTPISMEAEEILKKGISYE